MKLLTLYCDMFNSKYLKNIFTYSQGQCFIAVDPEAFGAGFSERMQDLMDICRGQPPVSGSKEI